MMILTQPPGQPRRFVAALLICLGLFVSIPPAHATDQQARPSVRNFQQGITLQVRLVLQGAYDAGSGLMRDSLRAAGLLPAQQPYQAAPFGYAGNESLNWALSPIALGGDADAVVDWVLLEVRAAADSQQVVAGKAVLVQADGGLMDAETGEVQLAFPNLAFGDYYISVRHRNHLGVMTAVATRFSADPVTLDFTDPALAVQGVHARVLSNGLAMLWGGDINHDQRLIANGPGNDLNGLMTAVLMAAGNPGFNASYILSGYQDADLNLDGAGVFVGPGNDANLLHANSLLHPGNGVFASNYIVHGGMEGSFE